MSTEEYVSVIIGDEFDESKIHALKSVLAKLGAEVKKKEWALAGSQELTTVVALVDGCTITVQIETYIGISITGPRSIIEKICEGVNEESNF